MADPQQFGKYQLVRPLAHGGMAEIFLAKQSGPAGFEKTVVIKRVLPHLAANEHFVHMFLDEARIAAQLSHPNVVQIFDFGEADGTYYLAMEYLLGEDLVAVLRLAKEKRQPIPAAVAARIVSAACDALHYAHTYVDEEGRALHIVHRDISPSNIFLTYQGAVKVLDFGIAKAEGKLVQTQGGILKGKFLYMSPEQILGQPLDARSDIFALGAVLHELVTGQPTFMRENELGMLRAITEEAVPSLRDLVPGISVEYDRIVQKALAKDVDQRWQSAADLRRALDGFVSKTSAESPTSALQEYIHQLVGEDVIKQKSRPPTSPGSKVGRSPDGKRVTGVGTDATALRRSNADARRPGTPAPIPLRESRVVSRPGPAPDRTDEVDEPIEDTLHRPVDGEDDEEIDDSAATLVPGRMRAPSFREDQSAVDTLKPNSLRAAPREAKAPTPSDTINDGPASERLGPEELSAVRPSRLPLVLGVVALLAAVGGGGYYWAQRSATTVTAPEPTDPKPVAKPDPEAKPEPGPDPKPEPVAKPDPKPEPEAKPNPEPVAKPDPKPEPTPDPKPKPEPRKPRSSGTLDLNCVPWCKVFVDGKDTGRNSPLKGYALPAGTHRIRVVNPPSGLEKELTVTIKAAESTQQIVRLE